MRNKVMIWMALVVALVMQGCQKEPINNDIEGFWQLEQFVVKDTREVVTCERLYYSITRMVTEVAEKEGPNGYGSYIGRTEYRNNETQLVLKDFKVRANTSDNKQDAPVEMLRHFGIDNQAETALSSITTILQPIILIVIGGAVGVLFYAVYAPLLQVMTDLDTDNQNAVQAVRAAAALFRAVR